MPSSNRVQLTSVLETTVGTTPTTPRMRGRRFNSEGFFLNQQFADSEEIRADGMASDPIMLGRESGGPLSYDMVLPFPDSPNDIDIRSALYSNWTKMPERFNDGTADSVITQVGTGDATVAVTTGAAFVTGQLVAFTGFGVPGNNGLFKCTTGSPTGPVFTGSTLTTEAAPAENARMKVIGFQGTSGDITATSTGLGSSTLDFTTLGLTAGMWIKIGGAATGDKFATPAVNSWTRIIGIAQNALTLDNRPAGWTADAGTGKTIKVWIGDWIRNGVTQVSQSFEKGALDQGVPNYCLMPGFVVREAAFAFELNRAIRMTATFQGMGGDWSTATQDAAPDPTLPQASFPVFMNRTHIGRITEGGSRLTAPNFVTSLNININNNASLIESIDAPSAVGITGHGREVKGTMEAHFGDNALLTKFMNGTPTSLAVVAHNPFSKQAMVFAIPRMIYTGGGNPNASGRNQDMKMPLSFTASKDEAVTNAMFWMQRFEYVEV